MAVPRGIGLLCRLNPGGLIASKQRRGLRGAEGVGVR